MQGKPEFANSERVDAPNNLFGGSVPIRAALHELRMRLLDLTGRNRLVNFKHSAGKSLQFVHTSVDATFQRITADQASRVTIGPVPEPDRKDWVSVNGRLSRPDAKEHAVQMGVDPSYELMRPGGRATASAAHSNQAKTLFYADDLGKYCRKLERDAKLAIEETGANMLYLVMGFLEFPEAPGSDKLYRAPLLCVPVAMTKTEEGQYTIFHLNHTGEELADNLSLREKVKRDFGLLLPEYDAEGDASPEAYFEAITQATASLLNWRVRRMMTLTLLSFSNMLMVRDLDPENWAAADGESSSLLSHPLVRQVFEGKPYDGESGYASEFAIDDHPKANLPLIYDADSSQHSALIDVLEGKNRVIEGPPGTGKSQTITNLIAAAIQSGKKVLFVAEKLAALQVVKSRLTQAGLDPFVLELHSNKANKKQVLDDLAARKNFRVQEHRDLPELLQRQEAKRRELQSYNELMKTPVGAALDLGLHQVMWRAERHRVRGAKSAEAVSDLYYQPALQTSSAQLAAITDSLKYLAEQLGPVETYGPEHPMWGFFPSEFKPQDDQLVEQTLEQFRSKFDGFAKASAEAATFFGGTSINMSAHSAEQLIAILSNIAPAQSGDIEYPMLPVLFQEADALGDKSKATIDDMAARQVALDTLEQELHQCLLSSEPASAELAQVATRSLAALEALGLASLTQAQLIACRDSLQHASAGAGAALTLLERVSASIGYPFVPTQLVVEDFKVLFPALISAPVALLHHRHADMLVPGTVKVLEQALQRLGEIERRQTELNTGFYADAIPKDAEIQKAVSTLRQGAAWYRVFQSDWRQAVKLNRTISRDKSKKSSGQRLAELESLLQQSVQRKAWIEDSALRKAAGVAFAAEKTPLSELTECARWVDALARLLERLEINPMDIDPLTIERPVFVRLLNQHTQVDGALEALKNFNSLRSGLLHINSKELEGHQLAEDWLERIRAADTACAELKTAIEILAQHVREPVQANGGLRALVRSREVGEMTDALENHVQGIQLLGDRFAGRATNLARLFNTHTYGRQIKWAGLPARIEQVLIAENCTANHHQLSVFIDTINAGWADVSAFNQAMAKFGTFEPTQWTDPGKLSTSGYAAALAQRTGNAADHVSGLLPWVQYVTARKQLVGMGLQDFVQRMESGAVQSHALSEVFSYRFYASLAQVAFEKSAVLKQFSGRRHSSLREEYAQLDKQIIQLRGKQVAADCSRASAPPAGRGGARVDDKTEMTLLEHLFALQRPRTTLRKMLKKAGNAIQELKPCFMMGPQAVAQFLEPGHLHFDIVVMDEASQLRPEEAIGAIARGTQLVVVGDPKQLPPTSFFARMNPTDGDDGIGQLATSDAESILDVCTSHFQPLRSLRWHYRSRHESLIAFSNHHFYGGKLVVFPSPYPKSKSLGVRYHYVSDGVYENNMNHVEARRVVDAVVEHILHRPDDSLGVVTLNAKQKELVSEMLEERLRSLPEAISYNERWEAMGMGYFVKNLENVQGDERDCILISTTFGKPKGVGVVRQNFGPISREGGWRRLNVLFTRARKSVAVFSSMRPEDIVSDAKTPEGTRALRNYLEYARTGVMPIERETHLPPDSDFEVSVIDVLKAKGYEVTPQLGVSGFRIDIGVKHPDHLSGYLAAIECDGASYHSGQSVRDRDRIRQEILEGLGWKGRIWRIWSTDWFRNPRTETERLLSFLEGLRNAPVPDEFCDDPVGSNWGEEPNQGPSPQQKDVTTNEVFDDEDELSVSVGDLVGYTATELPDQMRLVRLTSRQTDPAMGLVAEATPLGSVLMGACVGDTGLDPFPRTHLTS